MSSSSLIDKCCLVGQSVGGSPIHFMIERAFLDTNLDWRFMTFEVQPERLGDALRGLDVLDFRGVMLLEPLRTLAAGQLERLTDRAQRSGLASCLIHEGGGLVGDDLQGAAVVAAVDEISPAEARRALVIGANDAARSSALALADAGCASLWIADRDTEAAEALATRIGSESHDCRVEAPLWDDALELDEDAGIDLVVCATDATDKACRQVVGLLKPGVTLVDATGDAERSTIVREGAARGAAVADGLQVLVWETALALERWTGVRFSLTNLRDAAEEFLGV